jgi:hypothetical protein
MAGIRKPHQSGILVFWTLLEAIERTTQLELEAVQARDFQTMETLFDAKRRDFVRLVSLGKRLGLNRRNPELSRRLLALEKAQAGIALAAATEAEALRIQWQGADQEGQRLRSLKRAYVSDTLLSDFQAEG